MPSPANPAEKPRERPTPTPETLQGRIRRPLAGCTPYALALLAILVLLMAVTTPG
jgi:hypothetical protein